MKGERDMGVVGRNPFFIFVTETERQVASKKPSDGQTPSGPSERKQDQLPAFPIMASSGLAEGLGRERCLNRLLLIEIG